MIEEQSDFNISENFEKVKSEKTRKRAGLIFISILTALLILFLFFIYFFSKPIWISGTSMEPTLSESTNDRVMLLKKGYEINYGDIIVFERAEGTEKKQVVKRVIGKEGDRIEIVGGNVIRNGEKLEEDYLAEIYRDKEQFADEVVVGKGEIYILGDNRKDSLDSSIYGPINSDAVVGKVILVFKENKTLFIG